MNDVARSLFIAGYVVVAGCGTANSGASDGSEPQTATVELQQTTVDSSRARRLASFADSLFEIERKAASVAFGDPSGEGEGDENLLHTAFLSSLRFAELALQSDSGSADAEFVLGKVYAERSYRGFGVFDRDDLRAAKRFLVAAEAGLAESDVRRQRAKEILMVVQHNLDGVEGQGSR